MRQNKMLAMAVAVAAYVVYFGSPYEEPIVDDRLEPRVSGSYSSLVTALAGATYDPYLQGRPQLLGGPGANTGEMGEEITFGSIEEEVSE